MRDSVTQDEITYDQNGTIYPQEKSVFFETDDTGYIAIPADIQKQLDADFDAIMGNK